MDLGESAMERRELLAAALVLGFTVSFALTNTMAGLAYIDGSDPLTVATGRFIVPTVVLAVILWTTGTRFSLPKRDAYAAIGLGLITAAYSFAILSSIALLSVSLAVLIFFLFPLFTALIVAVMGWEKLTAATIAAAIVAFGGLALTLGVDAFFVQCFILIKSFFCNFISLFRAHIISRLHSLSTTCMRTL